MKQIHFFKSNSSLKNFKSQFDLLLKERKAVTLIRVSFFLLGLSWIIFGVFFRFLPPEIPLFFSKPWGESQLVKKGYFVLIPIILTFLFAINHRFASIGITSDKLLSYIFLVCHLTISFLGLTTMIRIIFLLI